MTRDDRFHRLEELYHTLAPLGSQARAPILDELREREPELCGDLERLLGRHDRPDDGSLTELFSREEPREGDRLGPYRLLHSIGEGGMGVVYEAQQDAPVSRRVAVKLIRRGVFSEAAVARFTREIEILALMNHPGVAQVYDAGTTEGGVPYVAMELVEGQPVTEYCKHRDLSIRDRLELFAAICAAVESAHQKGILHRDLKPSNILVVEDQGTPQPKVIDFGIARPIEGASADDGLTRAGEVIGTPEYMSPEQTRGAPLDTRSDIYSLAVVLYTMLTGSLPLRAEANGPLAADELRRRIREEDPELPSTRARKLSVTKSGEQKTELRFVALSLRGDLDWITMKGLAKDPDDRYSSVGALAADVAAHLRNEPVAAGPPSRWYRVAKFVRRHALGVAASALVVVALVAAATTSTVLFVRAEAARGEAEIQRQTAEEVSDFLQRLLAEANPLTAQSREEVTVRSLLDEASWQIDTSLGDQPRVNAELQVTVGDAYENLGLFDRAREAFARSLKARRGREPRSDEIESLLRLADLERFSGELDLADQLGSQAADLTATLDDAAAAAWFPRVKRSRALVAIDRGDYEAGERLLRDALAGARFEDLTTLEVMISGDLGHLVADRGRVEEAVSILEERVAVQRRATGDDHSSTAEAIGDLAWVLNRTGNNQRVVRLQREVLKILERIYPEHHPTVAVARDTLAGGLREIGRAEEAVPLAEQTLEDFRISLGAEHVYVAYSLNNVALALEQAGQLESAVERYRESVALHGRLLGDEHPDSASMRFNLARVLRGAGDADAARRECLESLRVRRQVLDPEHPDLARNLTLLAQLERDEGHVERAAELLAEALDIRRAGLAPGHPQTAATLLQLGEVELELGRRSTAEQHLQEALGLFAELAAKNPAMHEPNRARVAELLAAMAP